MWQRVLGCCLLLCASVAGAQQTAFQNPHGPLAQPCSDCHSPERWAPARISDAFDHGRAGQFPLLGAHAAAGCRSCHVTLDFRGTPRECVSCHRDPHRDELGTDCARCHSARSFLDRTTMTRAHQLTRFPLAGTHLTVECEACHAAPQGRPVFVAVSTECVTCHLKDFHPRIQQLVKELFGKEGHKGVNPDEVVAIGAAHSGRRAQGRSQRPAACWT